MNHNANPQTPKGRANYTTEENADLEKFIIQKRREGWALRGNLVYMEYHSERHSWQSIRDHAINFILPKLSLHPVGANVTSERTSVESTPMENSADNTSSPVISTIDKSQGPGSAQNASILQIIDSRELREQSNVTPIQSGSGGACSTPIKQIRGSSNLREESSSSVTPTRPVDNNSREQNNNSSTSRQSSVTLTSENDDDDDDRQSIANESDENNQIWNVPPKAILTKNEFKNFRDYLISQRNAGEGLYGSLIYRLYPGLHAQSWNYLRTYAIKHIIPKLSDDTNKDGLEVKRSKTTYSKPGANSSDDIYENDYEDDIINIGQIQDYENSVSSYEDSDAQTLVSFATIVEGDSPSPERVKCHFMANHDAGDYYPDGSVKTSRRNKNKINNQSQAVNKGKKAVTFNFSRSNQTTDNTSVSSSDFMPFLRPNDDNNESSEIEKITTPASRAVLQNNKQLSPGIQIASSNPPYRNQNRSIASSSRSTSSILSMEIDSGDFPLSEETMEQFCESPTIDHLSRQYSRDSTLNTPLATPRYHSQTRTFNQIPSSKALGKRPAPSTITTDNRATDHNSPRNKRKFSSIKNFDSSDLEKISNSKYGTQLLAEQDFFIDLESIATEFSVDRKEVMRIAHMTGCNFQMIREYFRNGRNIPGDKKEYFWSTNEDMELLRSKNHQSISTIKTNHGTKLFWERSEYVSRYYARDAFL
ncbi:10341_t:CDS:2 [Ambispora gerdemannii]|uniref:10341_t:CDS:1 n=1 Tax=Ambispora gerdemannii TaxID=144530 RepID=A0A9N9C7V3_9GLOM|nr:10341_t:CDS:2 [Ambispora gerdemannii]